MFTIKYSKQAMKTKAKMPKGIAEKIDSELEIIAFDPVANPGDCKRLQGSPFWRLRVGGWRAICKIVNNELIIYVLPLKNRISALTKSFSAIKVQKTTSNLLKDRIKRRCLQMNVQIIVHNGTQEYAVIPFVEWQSIVDRLEELEDLAEARIISAAIASGEETFPAESCKRLVSGESQLKVWREYRDLTLAALGKQCGVSAAALSQIENGKRSPSVDLLGKFSRALLCDMEDLHEVGDFEMAA